MAIDEKKCEGCAHKSTCQTAQDPMDVKLTCNLSKIKRKIGVLSGKGGVGKTTVATNLAAELAKRGFKVGLLDADLHGPNVAKMLGAEGQRLFADSESKTIKPFIFPSLPNLKVVSMAFLLENPDQPVIWRGPLKHQAIKQFLAEIDWGELDFLIVDLPPGTGDEALSVAQLVKPMDGFVIVTTPQEVSLLDTRKSISFAKMMNVPVIGIVENMSGLICPHCGKEIEIFKKGGGENAAKELGVPFLGRIPIEPAVVEAGDKGTPIVISHPESKSTQSFKKITDEILEKLGK
ncbi:ATPase-like, ParA/MinD [Desulfurobacterium thermolithotrophum DSM 11699]|uniref:Iron-sulfur cluster carrier protein n=1 Tax=Desulfurobacterium thermolithotrophum (strain DSM 11699 / BSA) TaxID=868864 RepID=F0S440_DESTD|nr:Mrp/NBP35 family ATP-binding protein [Desulfurobacterium thermolithotrophum]ADY73612.1 ATPase-like, ParA/MinD [Desulfurobacterium thermolithotrophum DSM 11699]